MKRKSIEVHNSICNICLISERITQAYIRYDKVKSIDLKRYLVDSLKEMEKEVMETILRLEGVGKNE